MEGGGGGGGGGGIKVGTKWRKYTKTWLCKQACQSTCSHVFSPISAHFYPHYIIMIIYYALYNYDERLTMGMSKLATTVATTS